MQDSGSAPSSRPRIVVLPLMDVASLYRGNQFDNHGAPPELSMMTVYDSALDSTTGTLESVISKRLNQNGTDRILGP